MRILICHNKYQRFGGEDAVVAAESKLLKEAGHQVEKFEADNEDIRNFFSKLQTSVKIIYNRKSRKLLKEHIRKFNPDIVHIHNFFPLLTPSIFDACNEMAVPVIHTLHNFRILCPTSLLMFDGEICERSLHGSSWWAIPKKVYRGSFFATFALVCMIEFHKKRGTWINCVTKFTTPSSFARGKFIEGGLPAHKVLIKPNFTNLPEDSNPKRKGNRYGAIFVGRLSSEKGLDVLLDAWATGIKLPISILGDGPLKSKLVLNALDTMSFLGSLSPNAVRQRMNAAQFLIMTSRWYETFGLVLIEAFSVGLPVIVPKLGAMAEIVKNGETGLYYEPGSAESLAEKVNWAIEHPKEMAIMGEKAFAVFQSKYSPKANLSLMEGLYEDVIGQYKRNR